MGRNNLPHLPKAEHVGSNSMTNSLIIEKAIEEIENKAFGATEQFLEIHKIVYNDNKPRIARVDTDKDDEAIVYFNIENEKFFLAVYIDTKPNVSVRWIDTEPYHSVYLRASSGLFSLEELAGLTKLAFTRGTNKGDKKCSANGKEILWKHSTIDFEPNPEADEFEDKLNKLLDYLEEDEEGVEKLVNKADYCCIHVYSSFHNGNTLIGGHHLERNQIKQMGNLNLEIDFDISADGNFFM